MIDLHAHILPGLDDGPPTVGDAVAMARAAVAAGTRAIATTSHVNLGFALGPADLATARAALAERLAAEGVGLELLQGGEVAPERLYGLDDATLGGVTLGRGPFVLLECPFNPVGTTMEPMVADLHRRGFRVLLAHPERSPTFAQHPARLEALVDAGALAQVTTSSFRGRFGGTARRAATTFVERGLVHVLASDGHSATHRSPDLRAVDGALDPDLHAWMADAVPTAIVEGREPPERPQRSRERGGMRDRLRAWSAR